ncbi:CRE-SIR-2.1 protein [Caenorhabditis remanei]|uniref:NAD-dependent protein deacetylase sir-2.1 n=1 Tax=Caenorhabditis remanei TaxID=31234 RepID=E3M5G7_CAERE|nr:CRE-SIR-2.1 protein [Caenorhabditis remanei]
MATTNGEVQEIREEEDPEISEMHIENAPEMSDESGDSGRTRTESATSISSESWQNNDEMMGNLRRAQGLLDQGATPLQIIRQIFPDFDVSRVAMMSENAHFALLSDLLERAPIRQKLPEFNSLADAVELFKTRKNILILTGAGVSVSCGIPDFRSKDGIYARLRGEFPNLPDPTAMFDIRYFRNNPAPFYNFAREIFPGQFTPSVSHRFIKELESAGRLLRNYTQNIDTLEHQTGIKRVVECHGSFSKNTCTECGDQTDGMVIREDVLAMRVARCKKCDGVIKPNIVFFGEDLGKDFHRCVTEDKNKVDLIVVIGSSLKVRPVALIPHCVGKDVPQILINRESLPHYNADIELLGNCDDIIRDICFSLGGSFAEMIASYDTIMEEKKQKEPVKEHHPVVSRNKRQLISQQEFLNICLREKNGASESDDEPNLKRPRMSTSDNMDTEKDTFHDIQKHKSEDDEDTMNSDDVLKNIKHPRLLNITEMLNDNKCVAISTYQTVFPGAECSFDLETLKLVREVNHYARSGCSTSESSSSDTVSQSNAISRAQSMDDFVLLEERQKLSYEQRSDSCDDNLQYELSDPINPETFSSLCEQMRIQ